VADSDELAYKTIAELAALLQSKALSPVELLDATLARIKQRNPSLGAFVYLNEEYAYGQAKEAERRLMAGEDVSPLTGLPTAFKDLADSLPGWTGTFGGIRALRNHVIPAACHFALSMERAGAISIGKTNSPTLGFRGTCDNYLHGPTRNPFDLTKNSGGSSGGAAAAVADGLVPWAEGTDGGGSLRIPAAWTNTYGFKGSPGSLPRNSRFPATTLFTFEGCVTRTVQDTAYVLDAMSGHDPHDPYSLREHVDYLDAVNESIAGWRVAYSPDFGAFPVDPRVQAICAEAARAFEAAGAQVEEVPMRINQTALDLGDLWCRLFAPNSIVNVDRLSRAGYDLLGANRGDLPPELLHWIEAGHSYGPLEQARDQDLRAEVYDAVQSVLDSYDLLLTPTLACLPVDNASDGNTLGPETVEGVPMNRLIGWCLTFPLNFTGHPAASVPAGLVEGLPVGLQIIGRKFADADVIAAGAAYERARPWSQHYAIAASRGL
jgi:amidase